jgi:hypothetical protein
MKKNVILLGLFFIVTSTSLFATDYTVSGAGTNEVNGIYVENGTYSLKPLYEFINGSTYYIRYENGFSAWMIWDDSGNYYYYTEDAGDTPPSTGWTPNWPGMPPAPTVSGGTLPVVLSTFTADFINNTPTIYWETQSEVDNMGWNIYRNEEEDFSSSTILTDEMIPGHGTTTEPSYYNFEDRIQNTVVGSTYFYWLESIDYSGISHVYSRVAQITIPDPSAEPPHINPPVVYNLKNVPNPVAGNTNFQFTLDSVNLVSIEIYNILGELVSITPSVITQKDVPSSVYWNGKDDQGKGLENGVYLYRLLVNGRTEETKKLILMK